MKRGRPKDISKSKNRVHSVVLSEEAELIFREISKKRGSAKWVHDYISHSIVDDFKNDSLAFELYELNVLTRDRNKLDELIKKKAQYIRDKKVKRLETEEKLRIDRKMS